MEGDEMAKRAVGLKIGAASVDITPPVGVELAGYGSRSGIPSTSVGHPLRAEAIVVRGARRKTWALVTSDFIGYGRELVGRVRSKAASATGLRPETILISAIHSHSAPAMRRAYEGELGKYKDELEARLAQVIVDAAEACAPGTFEVAWAQAPDLAHNRRVVQDDGTVRNEWEDHDGKHAGYYDPTVGLVAVRRPDGTRDALIVNYGCHPVVLGPSSLAISADYVGHMKDMLEARGAARTVLFALAGAGNINPRVCIQVGEDYPRRMGQELARIVLAAMDGLRELPGGPVASSQQPLSFVSQRRRPEGSAPGKDEQVTTEVMALRAGELAIVSVPGELFSEYAAMLRKVSPLPATLVVSLANDGVGYLPLDAALPQGGHEVVHRAAAEGIERPLMEAATKALAAVAA
jgi:hypothetical protein